MEHRYGARIPISLDVKVKQNGKKDTFYHTRDIGYGGAFIEGCQNEISNGKIVIAEIKITTPHRKQNTFIIKALIVHKSRLGIGLMWAGKNESSYLPLYEFLHANQKTSSQTRKRSTH